jgi:hypothetical protein
MEIETKHFKGVGEHLIQGFIEIANKLDPRLMKLLEAELYSGNQICSATSGWPSKNGVIIQLVHKINLKYELENGVNYKHVNDPHYWIHEFSTFNGDNSVSYDLLICQN